MFNLAQFTNLYTLLAGDMVDVDCGLRCEQYCCRAADAVKYLLPGEDEFYADQAPPNFQIVDHFLYLGYRARDAGQCACTRALRPFCCRIFPFRPVIDLDRVTVIDLAKATGAGFDLHCWVSEPRAQWRENAIAAWQFVLADEDNLNFYARYALFLDYARRQPAVNSSSVLYQVSETMAAWHISARWRAAAALFQMLGRPPEDWPELS